MKEAGMIREVGEMAWGIFQGIQRISMAFQYFCSCVIIKIALKSLLEWLAIGPGEEGD